METRTPETLDPALMEPDPEPPRPTPLEVWTPQDAARADRFMQDAGVPLSRLMEAAGYGVADMVAAICGYGVEIVAIAGPGDNGGDAFVAAEVLRTRGFAIALVDASGSGGSAASLAARAAYRGERLSAGDPRIRRAKIIIDGLFGGGLARPIGGALAELVGTVNGSDATVVAIDLPSGVNGATGAVDGPAIRADRTVTFERMKVGHLLFPGRGLCGTVNVVPIGISPAAVAAVRSNTYWNAPELWRHAIPALGEDGHKYHRGHALVVSGPMIATGAARLSAMAALRGGAGLVTLASPSDALMVNAAHLTTVMLKRVDGPDALNEEVWENNYAAVCLGPGLPPTPQTRDLVSAAIPSKMDGTLTPQTSDDDMDRMMPKAVVDAGALTAFAGDPEDLFGAICSGRTVLTPHEGEFKRLFPEPGDKLSRARAAAARVNACIVLKGADTVIVDRHGRAAINANAPPTLATAGTGDVLAGLITANLSRGMPVFEAAAYGVYLHGEAAKRAGAAMIADDLLRAVREARSALETDA